MTDGDHYAKIAGPRQDGLTNEAEKLALFKSNEGRHLSPRFQGWLGILNKGEGERGLKTGKTKTATTSRLLLSIPSFLPSFRFPSLPGPFLFLIPAEKKKKVLFLLLVGATGSNPHPSFLPPSLRSAGKRYKNPDRWSDRKIGRQAGRRTSADRP